MAVGNPDDWLQHARSDLRAAQLVRGDAEVLPSAAAFHAQQAAEKGLKAVLMHAAQSFPRTHDLKEILLRIDRAGIPVPVEVEAVRELTLFAVESRYPGDAASRGRTPMNDSAVADFSKALGMDPKFLDARRNRSTEYLRQKRYESAIDDFSAVLAEDGDDMGTLYKRAYAYCTSGKRKLGTKDLREVLSIDPKNDDAKALLRECT